MTNSRTTFYEAVAAPTVLTKNQASRLFLSSSPTTLRIGGTGAGGEING